MRGRGWGWQVKRGEGEPGWRLKGGEGGRELCRVSFPPPRIPILPHPRPPAPPPANARGPSALQITYSAINDELGNKGRFPAVLRTVPGADHQTEAIVQMLLHFRWNWIVVLASGDDYGRENSHLLSQRLAHGDICIAFQETLPTPQPNQTMTPQDQERLEAIVGKLQQSTARVVVVFSPELALHNFFREVLRQNLTGAVWIASESWAIDPVLHNLTELQRAGTFLGITTQNVPIPGFSEFRVRRSQVGRPALNRSSANCNQECDTCLNTTESFNSILTLSGERVVYSVYSSVYAVAHALHSLLGCNQSGCRRDVVYPWQVRSGPQGTRASGSRRRVRGCHGDHQALSAQLRPHLLVRFWASEWKRPGRTPCLQAHRSPSW